MSGRRTVAVGQDAKHELNLKCRWLKISDQPLLKFLKEFEYFVSLKQTKGSFLFAMQNSFALLDHYKGVFSPLQSNIHIDTKLGKA